MTETMPASSPVLSRPLMMGIALSLALHLAVLIGPQVNLQPLPELQRLDVTLVRTAPQIAVSESPPPAPPPVKKKPRPPAEPKTAQATITDKPVEQPEPVPAPEPAQDPVAAAEPPPVPEPEPAPESIAETAPEAAEDAPAPPPAPSATEELAQPAEATPIAGSGGQAWPRAGRITYLALMGEKQIPMGKATHQWQVADDGSYRISELVEPTTVAAIPWFRPGRKLRESTGRITEAGLRPERFTEREDGRPGEVLAELDRTTSEFRSAGTTDALPDNAQDILSLLYQLGYPGAAAGGSLPVTAGGALRSFQLETIGEETVHLPFGQGWRARHVRARYGSAREMTDVWLATEHFGLPILIRTIDPKGVIYYLVATEVMVSREALPAAPR